MMTLPGLLVAGVLSSSAWATDTRTIYVDCAAAPGGNGSATAPYATITAALPSARALSATHAVTIDVCEGVCADETLPIELDFPVTLIGARKPRYDWMGFPIDGQYRDTVITWTLPSPVPQGVVFVLVTGDNVKVSGISFDGKVPPQPDVFARAAPGPTGIDVRGAEGYVVESVRIVGAGNEAFRSTAASGVLVGSYLRSSTGNGMFVGGGDPVARVSLVNNRVSYRTIGLPCAGGTVASATIMAGFALELVAFRNDITTTYTLTGPTHPSAIRPSAAVSPGGNPPDGTFTGWFLFNRVSGPTRWSIMVHAGFPRFVGPDGPHATGALKAVFAGTTLDAAATASSDVLISFTASAPAVAYPCELNPDIPPGPGCPTLNPTDPFYSEYLEGAVYDLWDSGELGGAQIDHPEFAPYDGHELDNLLIMNGDVVDYGTFVVVP